MVVWVSQGAERWQRDEDKRRQETTSIITDLSDYKIY